MANLDRAHRRQGLVRLGCEVVPDVAANRVRAQRAAGVDAEQRDWDAQLARQIVLVEEVGLENFLAHGRLERFCSGPFPVRVPDLQIVRAVGVLEIDAGRQGWHLARAGVAARAPLGKNNLAALDNGGAFVEIRRAARRVLEVVRIAASEEIPRHVR